MEMLQEQFNRDPLSYGYIRTPYSLMRCGIPGKQLKVASVIYSFSNVAKRPNAQCVLSQTALTEYVAVSRATVNRALRMIRTLNGVKFTQETRREDGRRLPCSRYTLHTNSAGGAVTHFRFLLWAQFDMKDGEPPRRLRDLEETILSLLLTHASNPAAKRGFEASYANLANIIGRSESGVKKAVGRLLRAGLIHRPKRGRSGKSKSRYTVDRALRIMAGKEQKKDEGRESTSPNKASAGLTPVERAADERTVYERHYAALREIVYARVEQNEKRAERDETYQRVHKEIRTLEPSIAFAEVRDPKAVEPMKRRLRSLKVQKARALARLGMTPADLTPKWNCPLCEDTGYRKKDGKLCGCWRPPRRSK